jgi:PAS domain S-box-containing protein
VAAGDPMLVLSRAGDLVFVNESGEHLFGRSAADLARRGPLSLLPPPLAARFPWSRMERCLRRLARHGRSKDIDGSGADGSLVPVALRVAIVEQGSESFFVLSIRDIATRRRTMEALRQAERRYGQIIELTDEAMIAVDAAQRILIFNRGAERIFDYKAADIIGKPLATLLPPAYAGRHADQVANFGRGDFVSRHAGERGRIQGRRRSGELFPAEASISRFEASEGTIFTASIRDVSQREAAQAELERIATRLERVQEIAGLGYWELDLRRQEFFMSADLWRRFADLAPGSGWRRVLHRLSADTRRAIFAGLETARTKRDQRPIEIEYGDSVLRLEHEIEHDGLGRSIRLTGTVLDVTREHRSEEALRAALGSAEEASRAKSAFLASVSHELRTPLHAIIGFTELMSTGDHGPLPPAYAGYAADVLSSARHLLELINQLLDLSKLQLRHHVLDEGAFRLVDPARVALRLVTHQAAAAEVRLSRSVPPDLVLLGDERAIAHMIRTLLSTAIRFCVAGDRVSLTAGQDGDHVWLSVIDTGAGIPLEDLPHVTEPFHEMHSEVMRQNAGTALAMATVKGLVELHGGTFRIASTLGEGTRVEIRFPAERSIAG